MRICGAAIHIEVSRLLRMNRRRHEASCEERQLIGFRV
jgi:hypothetical protein